MRFKGRVDRADDATATDTVGSLGCQRLRDSALSWREAFFLFSSKQGRLGHDRAKPLQPSDPLLLVLYESKERGRHANVDSRMTRRVVAQQTLAS